ncbi:hypothetical protein BJ165DRAFT_1411120 [Panaeolus papilionaceus]|nr:hypothetical protein BJ165DRAFT_1411120 [Panaeolus papilionaceus]
MPEYRFLHVTGPISAKPLSGSLPIFNTQVTLLLGLTGVGKSNFLECLHGDHSLAIAGDSLESVTQDVVCYELLNVSCGGFRHPIYFVDCPGFADNHLSELQVVKKLQTWLSAQDGNPNIDTLLYFHRITDKRVSGSQRRALSLIKSMVGTPGGYLWVGAVTTMWDTLWKEDQLRCANERFRELKDEHLKATFGPDAEKAFQFHNTQESALRILDDAMLMRKKKFTKSLILGSLRDPPFKSFSGSKLRKSPFALQLYQLLVDRIAAVQQQLRNLNDDIGNEPAHSNQELLEHLTHTKAEAEANLATLQRELVEFGEPPRPKTNFRDTVISLLTRAKRDQ